MEEVIVTSFDDEESEVTLGDVYVLLLDLLKINTMLQSTLLATSIKQTNTEERDALIQLSLFKVQQILDGYLDNPETIIN